MKSKEIGNDYPLGTIVVAKRSACTAVKGRKIVGVVTEKVKGTHLVYGVEREAEMRGKFRINVWEVREDNVDEFYAVDMNDYEDIASMKLSLQAAWRMKEAEAAQLKECATQLSEIVGG